MEIKRFVVVGVQRSGTTLVTTSLDSHRSVYCAGELFKMRNPRAGVDVRDGGYRNYINTSVRLKLSHHVFRRGLVRNYLDSFFNQPGFEAVGFKLMRNHLYPGQFPSLIPYLIDRQIRVIHVIRDNVLKTHLSRLMAQRSGMFHGTRERDLSSRIEIPTNDLVHKLSRIAEQNAQLTQIFAGNTPYLACTYEQFSADHESEARRLLEFLELKITTLRTPLVKLTSDDLSAIVENLDVVRDCLRGTQFEKWI